MACEIVESFARDYAREYARDYAKKVDARRVVSMIDNAVANLKTTVEEASKILGISIEEYQEAKALLADSQDND